MINNKVQLSRVRNYIQYPMINHMKKNKKKNTYIFMCINESHCYAAELKATLKISHTSIQFLEKNKTVPWFSSIPVSFILTPAPCFLYRECRFSSHIPTIQTLFLKNLFFNGL